MAEICGGKWWAWQGLNLRPLRCQHIAYRQKAQKTAVSDVPAAGTSGERMVNRAAVYRSVTASPLPHLPPSLGWGGR